MEKNKPTFAQHRKIMMLS